ncbi:hypothetical protein OF83DRAFT_775313 [Amylostereum chailletii]|nr:hypothetical protein OF83DRAFT_775313 [Amylostereum chailletii]
MSSISSPMTTPQPNMDGYMFEYELDADGNRIREPTFDRWKLTQRAQDARRAKWQRLMDNRPPVDIIPSTSVAENGRKPPLLFYGFPYKYQFMVNYARRHSLELELVEEDRISHGTDALRFAEVKDEDVTWRMEVIAAELVARHLGHACGGIKLHIGSPLSFEWDGILALWTNYDMYEQHRWMGIRGYTLKEVVAIIHAMNEDGHKTEIKWWWDFQNDVNVFTTLN